VIAGVGLVKSFGERRALAGVDVELAEGECLAVLGPNGAGKSTLLRMLATLLRPDAGELSIAGRRLPEGARRARGLIGYLGHDPLLYLDLTPRQNLELFADLYGVPSADERIDDMLERVGLLARAFDPVRTFSRGMAQRLGIARLLLHRPSLLLLDEPYAGLDVPGEALLDAVLDEARGAQGVVIVTHDVERAVGRADRVLVLRSGRVALSEPTAGIDPAAFRRRYRELVS
jgi:heme exporter protein A